MDYEKIMAKARKTNKYRDNSDSKNNLGMSGTWPLDVLLRTAMSAIECGIKIDNWDCVAEGQGMLEHLHKRLIEGQ